MTEVTRLRGGTKKGVFRLAFPDGSTAIRYVWGGGEGYWPAESGEADPFADASGLPHFLDAKRHLDAAGVRTPLLVEVGREFAIVEDVAGGTLESALANGSGEAALRRLAEMLALMAKVRGRAYGKVGFGEQGGNHAAPDCQDVVLVRVLRDLAEAAARDSRVDVVRGRLESLARQWFARLSPRREYALVHGELGPDHVLLTETGEPVVIDIEGLTFFDVEWEHAFLRIRFGDRYPALAVPNLDEDRVAFYTLAQRLSLVSGPLRLVDAGFPDTAAMTGIAEHNLAETLRLLG
jgi:aminoglycoside phosphotransferase (APT) family kinase protein